MMNDTVRSDALLEYDRRQALYEQRTANGVDALTRWFRDELELEVPDQEKLERGARWVHARMRDTMPPDANMRPRGLGANWIPCFICGLAGENTDMASFVNSKASGEEIVAMFEAEGLTAKLDWRSWEANWVQVKVGACPTHTPNLALLMHLVCDDCRVTPARLREAAPSVLGRA